MDYIIKASHILKAGTPSSASVNSDLLDDSPEGSECVGRMCRSVGYDHTHCALCRDAIFFEDGGRELDGTVYRELPDDAMKCSESKNGCDNYIHKSCSREIDGKTGLCYQCEREIIESAHDDALLENGLSRASEDIRDVHKGMLRETDTNRLLQLRDIHVAVLKTQLLLLEKAIDNKLAVHNAVPFIFARQAS